MSAPVRPLGRLGRLLGLAATAALLATLIPLSGVAAGGVSITPATGGTAISADTNATDGTNTATTLGGPSIIESAAGDIATNGTITLTLPSGFQYAASSSTTAPIVTSGCGVTASAISYSGSPTGVATVTISGAPSTAPCTIVFSGLSVVPSTHSPTSGSITVGGTAGVSGSAGTLTEVAGAASSLTFTTPPSSSAFGGTPFAQQPQVTDLDRFGNPRSGKPVSLSLVTYSGSGTLSCPSNPAFTSLSGVASFAGCAINKVGTYALRAFDGIYSPTSSQITVTVGPAAALAFLTYPAATTTTNLGNITVAVVDAGGNTVTTASGTVTLAISANAGTFSCGGVTNPTATLFMGVATFSNCLQTTANASYTITASTNISGIPAKQGTVFTVTSGPASKLALCWGPLTSGCNTTPPTNIAGGTPFPAQPTVVLQDANGNTVTSDNTTTVALSITPGTPYATSAGTLTCLGGLSMRVTAGVASFSGCAIDKAASGYRLTANSYPIYTPATSNTFNVSVGPPTQLVFTAQPTAATANQPFPIQPVVAIADAGGNTVPSTSATITLSILNNPAGGTLTCTGGLSKTTYLGVATFGGCSINNAGAGYTLSAVATNVTPYVYLASIATNLFNVIAPVAQITLTPSASVITWAQPVTITAQFALNGAGKTFALQTSTDAVNWVTTTTLTADSSGQASFTWTPVTNLWYRAVFAGTPDLSAGTSNQFRVVVRQIALLRPTNSGKVKTIAGGTEVTFTTTVRPARPELVRAKVTFTFTLYQHGRLIYSGKRDVYIDSAGLARWTWKFGTWGDWYVRAVANPTPANANSYWSPIERYYVY